MTIAAVLPLPSHTSEGIQESDDIRLSRTPAIDRLSGHTLVRRLTPREVPPVEVSVLIPYALVSDGSPVEPLDTHGLLPGGVKLAIQLADLIAGNEPGAGFRYAEPLLDS